MADTGVISETRLIPAPAGVIFELLADPAEHRTFDGSGSVQSARTDAPARLSLGAHFGMNMKIGAPYKIENTVVEFEEGRRIAWRHFGKHVWRYILEPVDDHSTRVTEQFDPTAAARPWVYRVIGFRRRNQKSITQTLLRLESWATEHRR